MGSNIREDERSKTWYNHLHVMKQDKEKSEEKKGNGVRESRVGTYFGVCPCVIALCFSLNVKDDWQIYVLPWHLKWEEKERK